MRDLDRDLLRYDRRLSWAICIAIVAAYVCAFAFADPGSPAAAILRMVCGTVRG